MQLEEDSRGYQMKDNYWRMPVFPGKTTAPFHVNQPTVKTEPGEKPGMS
ncbi:hypothetical protein [Larkinella rosea]|nr:hypothetical protein [Larkinella rosea]